MGPGWVDCLPGSNNGVGCWKLFILRGLTLGANDYEDAGCHGVIAT